MKNYLRKLYIAILFGVMFCCFPPTAAAATDVSFVQLTLAQPTAGDAFADHGASVTLSVPYACERTVWQYYSPAGQWCAVDGTCFETDFDYRAVVVLRPKTGSVFLCGAAAETGFAAYDGFVDVRTGEEADVIGRVCTDDRSADYGCLFVTVDFPKLTVPSVTSVAINELAEPVIGASPDTTFTAVLQTDSATLAQTQFSASIQWKSGADGGIWSDFAASGSFEAGKYYCASITIQPSGSYFFPHTSSGSYSGVLSVNGIAQHGTVDTAGTLHVTLNYERLTEKSITAAAVTDIDAPSPGAQPDSTCTVSTAPSGAASLSMIQWQKSRDRTAWSNLSATGCFEQGYYYRVRVWLKPQNESCAFSCQSDGTYLGSAAINGHPPTDGAVVQSGSLAGQLQLTYEFGALQSAPAQAQITAQPTDIVAPSGTAVTLRVSAVSADGGTLSYQWYTGSSRTQSTMTALPGCTESACTVSQAEGTAYYCVAIWNSINGLKSEPIYSDVAAVTTEAVPTVGTPVFTRQPISASAQIGDSITLSAAVSASGAGTLTLQWYTATDDEFRDKTIIPGAVSADYTVPETEGTRYYRLEACMTNGKLTGETVCSNTVSVAYTAPPAALERIELLQLPNRRIYTAGDVLNPDGMRICVILTNERLERTEGFSCSPMVLTEAGVQTITVSYGGKHACFDVVVNPAVLPADSSEFLPDSSEVPADSSENTAQSGLAEHVHHGSEYWQCDSHSHYRVCSCGERVEYESHRFVTQGDDRVCTVCGFTEHMENSVSAAYIALPCVAVLLIILLWIRFKKQSHRTPSRTDLPEAK